MQYLLACEAKGINFLQFPHLMISLDKKKNKTTFKLLKFYKKCPLSLIQNAFKPFEINSKILLQSFPIFPSLPRLLGFRKLHSLRTEISQKRGKLVAEKVIFYLGHVSIVSKRLIISIMFIFLSPCKAAIAIIPILQMPVPLRL